MTAAGTTYRTIEDVIEDGTIVGVDLRWGVAYVNYNAIAAQASAATKAWMARVTPTAGGLERDFVKPTRMQGRPGSGYKVWELDTLADGVYEVASTGLGGGEFRRFYEIADGRMTRGTERPEPLPSDVDVEITPVTAGPNGGTRGWYSVKALTPRGAAVLEGMAPPSPGDRRGVGIFRTFATADVRRLTTALEGRS